VRDVSFVAIRKKIEQPPHEGLPHPFRVHMLWEPVGQAVPNGTEGPWLAQVAIDELSDGLQEKECPDLTVEKGLVEV
jgi:hypothetical protein